MPPKKKKQKEEAFLDVMSCLDVVEKCLKKAERSGKACLEGILKADEALRESVGDTDIQCVVLVKRTELIFIAVKNNYNLDDLDDLPGQKSQYTLRHCVADCERVISDVSAEDVAGKQLRASAKAVCIKAQKLMKDREYEEKKKKGATKSNHKITETTYDPTFKRYDPSKTCFKTIYKINPHLLQDIVECYKKARNFCRVCYYKRHTLEPAVARQHCPACKKIPQLLVMIPASNMCENLSDAKYVAVPLPPKMMMQPANKHRPFQICKNQEHQLCDTKATLGDNWFAHSIEELVIWTVQRHYGCRFEKYIEKHHTGPPDPSPFSPLSQGEPSEDDGVDTDDLFSDSYSENNSGSGEEEYFEYYPDGLVFDDVKAIPQGLLLNIIEKYRNTKDYCKHCYYKTNKQGVEYMDRHTNQLVCSICHGSWNPVKVIPASELCWNFGDFEFLPLAPWPEGKPKCDPFEYCKKKDHWRCFRVYTDSDFWYPHSVEEMVVWTVERGRKCTFSEYINRISTIPGTVSPGGSGNRVPPLDPQTKQPMNYNAAPRPPPHPQVEDGGYFPRSTSIHPMGPMIRGPRPPLLSTPSSISPQQPHPPGLDVNHRPAPLQSNVPPGPPTNGMAIGGRPPMPFPPQFAPPGPADYHHFNGGGGGGGPPPMMYISQPPGAMYAPGGRALFVPRIPMGMQPGTAPNQPAMHQYPGGGPNQPPRVMAMTPQTMYNPYMAMNPNFNVPMYRQAAPPGVLHAGGMPETGASKQIIRGDGDGGSGNSKLLEHSSPAGTSQAVSLDRLDRGVVLDRGVASTIASRTSSSQSQVSSASTAASKSAGKVSVGRKNYKVAQPQSSGGVGTVGVAQSPSRGAVGVAKTPTRGGGGAVSVAQSPSRGAVGVAKTPSRGEGEAVSVAQSPSSRAVGVAQSPSRGAMGVASSGRSPAMEVKTVVAPIPAIRVESPLVFKFSEVNFKSFLDIPEALVQSIALCFQKKAAVCRRCFYGERSLSEKSVGTSQCSAGEHTWLKPVLVIPGCTMCNNEPSFQPGEHIPVPPLPPVAVLKKCLSRNHHKCFTKCLEKDPWQAHSVEELVVWMVESEKDCSFEDYAKALQASRGAVSSTLSPNSIKTSPSSATVGSGPATPSSAARPLFRSPPPKPSPPIADSPPTEANNPSPQASPGIKPKSVKKYQTRDISFVVVDDIPPDLLTSVAACFKSMRTVCRVCFFESTCTALVSKKDKTCRKEHLPWKSVRVIPRSPLCHTPTVYVPLPPLPKHMKQSNVPFVVCKKTDHRTCFAMSKGTNPWFPHTVEELVVWTVERECAQPFEDVYTRYLKHSDKQSNLVSPIRVATRHLGGSVTPGGVASSPVPGNFYSSVVVADHKRETSWKVSTPDADSAIGADLDSGKRTCSSVSDDGQVLDGKRFGDVTDDDTDEVLPEFALASYRSQTRNQRPYSEALKWREEVGSDKWWSPGVEEILGMEPSTTKASATFSVSAHDTSYTMDYDSEFPGTEDCFVHQSQVEHDLFQPYASSAGKSPLLLPGLGTGIEGEGIPRSTEIGLEERDWNDEDDVDIEDEGDRRDVLSPERRRGRVVQQRSDDDSNNNNSKAPGSSGLGSSGLPSSSKPSGSSVLPSNSKAPGRSGLPSSSKPSGSSGLPSSSKPSGSSGLPSSSKPSGSSGLPSSSKPSGSSGLPSSSKPSGSSGLPSSSKTPGSSGLPSGVKTPGNGGLLPPASKAPGGKVVGSSMAPGSRSMDALKRSSEDKAAVDSSTYGLEMNGGLWDNTSWGLSTYTPSNNFMASAFAAANSITDKSDSKPKEEGSFPSALVDKDPKDTAIFGSSATVVTNSVKEGEYFCLLCYSAFKTAGELFSHCSSDSVHQERAMVDTGAKEVWQYPPPPPQQLDPSLQVCDSSPCRGPPHCERPHSQGELREWLARKQHREQRRKEGSLRLVKVSSRGDNKNGIPISASKVLQANVSSAYKIENSCYRWDITIQGKNCLHLFGVTISSSSSWIFKITHIEEPVIPSIFHPHSSSWVAPPFRHAPKLRQCLLLGLVEIKVKAIPPSNKKQQLSSISAEVRLDLGFEQFFCITLQANAEGPAETEGSANTSNGPLKKHSPGDDQPTFNPRDTPTFDMPTFVPKHSWKLSQNDSSSSDDLDNLNIEGEDLTLQHVPIEDWGCTSTGEQSQERGHP